MHDLRQASRDLPHLRLSRRRACVDRLRSTYSRARTCIDPADEARALASRRQRRFEDVARQLHREPRAFARLALDADAAAVRFDEVARHEQADAEAPIVAER